LRGLGDHANDRLGITRPHQEPRAASIGIPPLARELRSGHRAALARAITLIESRRADHQAGEPGGQ
jgi:hypothetical protein